MVLYFLFHFV